MTRLCPSLFRGVWSAAPTPFTSRMEIDVISARRMVDHHIRLGVKGLFLAGSNGEGPWMTDGQRRTLVRTVARHNRGRLPLAVQVTDNSAARILDNMAAAKEDGAALAIIAPPYFLINVSPKAILDVYLEAIRNSPLPVGIYDKGGTVRVPDSVLKAICAEEKVVAVKDSSMSDRHMNIALAAKRKRPELMLLTGWEFNCVKYLKAGYDGLLLGGAVFNGYLANQIMLAAAEGDMKRADKLQQKMNRLMYAVYGGKKGKCWLSGEKRLLQRMGIFRTHRNYPNYPLTPACRNAIERVLKQDVGFLFP